MGWDAVREHPDGSLRIKLRQAKTGALIEVPVPPHAGHHPPGNPGRGKTGAAIAFAARGRAMAVPELRPGLGPDGLASRLPSGAEALQGGFSKGEVRPRLLKSVGVQRRDLRRTSMVRMAEAGASTAQIAGVSGHTIEQTRRLLDTYIPRRAKVAAGAFRASEAMEDRQLPV